MEPISITGFRLSWNRKASGNHPDVKLLEWPMACR